MKLSAALETVTLARARPVDSRIALACGLEPLHLKTFLEAHFAERFPGRRLEIASGLYGDVEGNVLRAERATVDGTAIVLEWGDLDPRLGLRSVGAWSGAKSDEIVRDVTQRLERLSSAIRRLGARGRVAVCLPTIPLTFFGSTSGVQHSVFEIALQRALSRFSEDLSRSASVMVLHPSRLDVTSPVSERHDARSELAVGFPYRLPHASALACMLIALLFPPPPKKALITDLDETLWAGFVGETEISWTPSRGAQIHALYQLVLRQLADIGVLIGAASKNDAEVVRAALARSDLLLDGARLFPVVASWGAKSESVSSILRTWNVAADAAVFVDDSPMELDEVRQVHPELECLLFPRRDPAQALRLFDRLRDLFGKPIVTADDGLRNESLRANAAFQNENGTVQDQTAFLRRLNGVLTFRRGPDIDVQRTVELLNKTNQFNLHGERVSDLAFARLLEAEHGFVLQTEYEDRYGPLGTVGVIAGRLEQEFVDVLHWVLSCRAFSRRIEHHMLSVVMRLAHGRPVRLHFTRTARNGPLQALLRELGVSLDATGPLVLGPAIVSALADSLLHSVSGVSDG